MSTVNHTSHPATRSAPREVARLQVPRLTLSSRWAAQPTRPRLVTFSWAAVVPSMSHR